jgi:hypothetical protein
VASPAADVAASGSRSHENRDPKGKCWTTGNFDSTSALNILIMPLLILPQPSRIPDTSKSTGLCSQKGPVLTSLMKPMAEKYMFAVRRRATVSGLRMSAGLGAPGTEPSSGMGSLPEIGRVSCAEPKM